MQQTFCQWSWRIKRHFGHKNTHQVLKVSFFVIQNRILLQVFKSVKSCYKALKTSECTFSVFEAYNFNEFMLSKLYSVKKFTLILSTL